MRQSNPRSIYGPIRAALGLVSCLAVFAQARPAPECLVSWRAGAQGAADVRCIDGDPACDADGQADGGCSVSVSVCVATDACASTLASPSALAVRGLTVPPLSSGCSAAQVVRVGRGRELRLVAVARDAQGATDRDRVRVRCLAASAAAGRAVVITTDFASGLLQTARVAKPHRVGQVADAIHSDAVLRVAGGRVYVVNRLGGDNVQVLDPARGLRTTQECSTGVGSNPHDVAVLDRHLAYVTRYDSDRLWLVDPEARNCDAGFRLGTIDLSPYADADGLPEMDQLLLDGSRLYVTLQRLDRTRNFAPTDHSALVVIDTATNTVLGVKPLDGRNAFGDASGIQREPGTGRLLINQAGNIYQTGDGWIERVDPDLNATAPAERLITEDVLGGNVTDFVITSSSIGYAIVLTDDLKNRLVKFSFDPPPGRLLATLYTSQQFLPDIALAPDGTLWLADRTRANPGIRIFDPANGDRALGQSPLQFDLPPFAMGFLP